MSTGYLINLTDLNRPLLQMMTTEKSIPENATTMAVTEDGYLYFTEEQTKEAKNHISQGRIMLPHFTMISYYTVEFEE